MDTDKLSRITRRAYLFELALAGLEAHAEHSAPADLSRHFEPVQELADDTSEVRGARKIAAARKNATAARLLQTQKRRRNRMGGQ